MFAIVHTQWLENYGDAESPFWKFKGGATFLVPNCSRQQDAMARICGHLFDSGRGREEYPTHAALFDSEEAAVGSVEEWERDSIERLP